MEASMTMPEQSHVEPTAPGSLRQHATMLLAEGVILMLLGVLAILLPQIATLGATILIGWLFLASGVLGLVATFSVKGAPGFWWSLLSAVLAIAAGIVLLVWPMSGALSLTLVMIAFFIIEGVVTIMYALEHRRELSGRWEWMALSGGVDLVLAALLLAGYPATAAWALGLMLGINLLFGGMALLALGLYARRS
jgi:uncharacterized membrane protein HdeD (DUF308 family)